MKTIEKIFERFCAEDLSFEGDFSDPANFERICRKCSLSPADVAEILREDYGIWENNCVALTLALTIH